MPVTDDWPYTMWGFWKSTMGCNDFLNGTAAFWPGVKDSISDELVALPRSVYTKLLRVNCRDPLGATMETYAGANPYPGDPSNLPLQSDFTYTNNPHNAVNQNFSGVTIAASKPCFSPQKNKIYYFYAAYLSHSYFVPVGQPKGPGNFQNYYSKFYVLEVNLSGKTITRKLVTGINQLNFDSWNGDVTTGTFIGIPNFFGQGFSVAVGNHLYVSAYTYNNVYYMFKIDLNTFAGTMIDITASGWNNNNLWLAGYEDNSGCGWCVPTGTLGGPLIRVDSATDTITRSGFQESVSYIYTDMIVDYNGDVWASPYNAPGVLYVDTSEPRAYIIGNVANYSSAGSNKSSCLMTNGQKVLVVPRGDSTFRTFAEIDILTKLSTSYYANFGFTSNPFSSDVFVHGLYTADNNFFCVPNSQNNDSLLIGGIRTQPPTTPLPGPPKRTGGVGLAGKQQGLRQPFILYDWRNWDGGFLLKNEGTAGPFWDLAVITWNEAPITIGIGGLWFWKQAQFETAHFDGSIVGNPYTLLFAVGDGDYIPENGGYTNAYFETNAFQVGPTLSYQGAFDIVLNPYYGRQIDDWDMGFSPDQFENYLELWTENAYTHLATVRPDSILGKTVIMTVDNNNGGGAWWVGGVHQGNPVDYIDPIYGNTFDAEVYDVGIRNDYNAYKLNTQINGLYRFFHYGFDAGRFRTDMSFAGQIPDACVGMAIFRGEPADQDEVDYWSHYFDLTRSPIPIPPPVYPPTTSTEAVDYLLSLNPLTLWHFTQADVADHVVQGRGSILLDMGISGVSPVSTFTMGPDGINYPKFGDPASLNYGVSGDVFSSYFSLGYTFLVMMRPSKSPSGDYATLGNIMSKQISNSTDVDVGMNIGGGSNLFGYTVQESKAAAKTVEEIAPVPYNTWNLFELYFPPNDSALYIWRNGLPFANHQISRGNYGVRYQWGLGLIVVGRDTKNNYDATGYYAFAAHFSGGGMNDVQRGNLRNICINEGWFT